MTIRSSYIVMIKFTLTSSIYFLSPLQLLRPIKVKWKNGNRFIIKEIIYVPDVFSVESLKTFQLGCLHLPRTTSKSWVSFPGVCCHLFNFEQQWPHLFLTVSWQNSSHYFLNGIFKREHLKTLKRLYGFCKNDKAHSIQFKYFKTCWER